MDGIMTWHLQVLSLAKYYAVYVSDFIFFGGVSIRVCGESVEKCSVVGFSYGGFVGFKMAQMYPELVRSLVVTGSVVSLTESLTSDLLRRLGFCSLAEFLLPESVESLKSLCRVAASKVPFVLNFMYKDILKSMFNNRKERRELLEALVVKDTDFILPHYTQKILLLWGESDRIIDMKMANNLKEQIGETATLEVIEKAGQIVNCERPFIFNEHLMKFLSSLEQEDVVPTTIF